MPGLVRFAECESSVFVSYAHADNELSANWVADFANELKKDLAAELSRLPTGRPTLPPVHLSQLNGPTAGELAQELKQRVATAFAMVIVVGRQYVGSDWCLNELQYFRDAFGDAGLDNRLFIIALGEQPIRAVEALPAWRACFAGRNQVWQPFYDEGVEGRPVPVLRDDGLAPTQAFARRFDRMRDTLVERIKADLTAPQPARVPTRLLIGVGVPELEPLIQRFAEAARGRDPSVQVLERKALDRKLALKERLRDAERLVLPFNQAQPLFPSPAGGHLAVLIDTWRELGKLDEQMFALDLSEVAPSEQAEPEHQAFLAALALPKLPPDALLARLFPPPAPAASAPAGPCAAPRAVRLFIESNQFEVRQWKLIGEQIRRRWQKLLDERHIDVPLNLRPSGLNIDELKLFNLDEADGLILLWGQKEAASLVSQINLVEDRLSELAPAIVAYLSPPQKRAERAVPALQWQVLRFSQNDHPPPEDLAPEADDEGELTLFLADVLDRTSRRHKLQFAAA